MMPTDKHPPLLEVAAQVFNDPIINEDGSIACRWVKKTVAPAEYHKRYASIPSYCRLQDDPQGRPVVAFRAAVHLIDLNKVSYCSAEDISAIAIY